MASVTVKITGLEEFKKQLHDLPDHLKTEAGAIVVAQAEQMAVEVVSAYPKGPTGNLKAHVRVESAIGPVSATAKVLSTARHAWIYEYGTKARQYSGFGSGKTKPAGWKAGKGTGAMPAGNKFVPIAIARRRVMVAQLQALIERAGLTVTGSAPKSA